MNFVLLVYYHSLFLPSNMNKICLLMDDEDEEANEPDNNNGIKVSLNCYFLIRK